MMPATVHVIDATKNYKKYRTARRSRLMDVAKMFNEKNKYSGNPRQPLRRTWESFLASCSLAGVDTEDSDVMIPLIQTTFLLDQALIYFKDVVIEAVGLLEAHFLSQRARGVNDGEWSKLSFMFAKQKMLFDKQKATNESVLNELMGSNHESC